MCCHAPSTMYCGEDRSILLLCSLVKSRLHTLKVIFSPYLIGKVAVSLPSLLRVRGRVLRQM